MAKIRSTTKLNWGGWNPFIQNFIEIEIQEVSKSDTQISFLVKDTVIGEQEYLGENNETLINEYPLQVIREKRFSVPMELYNQLYQAVESQMPAELTPFEKEKLRPKLAFLYYFGTDKILDENQTEFCLYGTQPNDWVII